MGYHVNCVVLDNGLEIYHVYVPGVRNATLIANVNVGSVYEDPSNNGISHLIEHMLFRGTGKRPDYSAINREMESFGQARICYTNYNNIPLGMNVPTEYTEDAADFISDLLYNSKFEKSSVDIERKLIANEIAIDDDNLFRLSLKNLYRNLYENGCVFNRIGSKDVVMNLAHDDVLEFYMDFFTPDNTQVFYAGPESLKRSVEIIERTFPHDFRKCRPKDIPRINECAVPPRFEYIAKPSSNSSYISTGLPMIDPTYEEELSMNVLKMQLGRKVFDTVVHSRDV